LGKEAGIRFQASRKNKNTGLRHASQVARVGKRKGGKRRGGGKETHRVGRKIGKTTTEAFLQFGDLVFQNRAGGGTGIKPFAKDLMLSEKDSGFLQLGSKGGVGGQTLRLAPFTKKEKIEG